MHALRSSQAAVTLTGSLLQRRHSQKLLLKPTAVMLYATCATRQAQDVLNVLGSRRTPSHVYWPCLVAFDAQLCRLRCFSRKFTLQIEVAAQEQRVVHSVVIGISHQQQKRHWQTIPHSQMGRLRRLCAAQPSGRCVAQRGTRDWATVEQRNIAVLLQAHPGCCAAPAAGQACGRPPHAAALLPACWSALTKSKVSASVLGTVVAMCSVFCTCAPPTDPHT